MRREKEARSILTDFWNGDYDDQSKVWGGELAHLEPTRGSTTSTMTWMKRVFDHQVNSGALVFDKEHQALPLYAIVLWDLYQGNQENDQVEQFVKEMFPKCLKLHLYYYLERNPLDNGLVEIHNVHNAMSAVTEVEMPYVDITFMSILCWANDCLLAMGYALEMSSENLYDCQALSLHAMDEYCWNEKVGAYQSYDLRQSRQLASDSHFGFMPMLSSAPSIDQVIVMITKLYHGDDTDQVDVLKNWLWVQALMKYELDDLAESIKSETIAYIDEIGFSDANQPSRNARLLTAVLYLELQYAY